MNITPRATATFLPLLFSTALALLAGNGPAVASPEDNWPQWRGPLANGLAPIANPPTSWSETNNVKWKVKIPGDGQATPIIWDKLVFIQTAIPTGKKVTPLAEKPAAPPPPAPADTATNSATGRRRGGAQAAMISEKPDEFYQFTLLLP